MPPGQRWRWQRGCFWAIWVWLPLDPLPEDHTGSRPGWAQQCAGTGYCWLTRANCMHFFPTLCSLTPHRLLEISYSGSDHTMEISKCCTSGIFFFLSERCCVSSPLVRLELMFRTKCASLWPEEGCGVRKPGTFISSLVLGEMEILEMHI